MFVSVRHPDAIVVVQQHFARLLTALRSIIELKVIVSLFPTSPPSPIANTSPARGYMSTRAGHYLIVDRMQQRHQRVQRAIHKKQLSLLRVKRCCYPHLTQCRLVVCDVLKHLHESENTSPPPTRRDPRCPDRDIPNGSGHVA